MSYRRHTSDRTPIHTYVLRCRETGRLKIGRTTQPEQRLRTLRSSAPTTLDLIGFLSITEATAHDALAGDRLHGEWFEPTDHVVQFVRDHLVPRAVTFGEYLQLAEHGFAAPPAYTGATTSEGDSRPMSPEDGD